MNELVSLNNRIMIEPEVKKRDLTQAFFNSFVEYSQTQGKTMMNYRTFVKPFFEYLEEKAIKQPSRDDIHEYWKYLDKMISKKTNLPISQATKNQYFQAMKHFFKWLSYERLYPDITKGIKSFKVNQIDPSREALTREDFKKIFSSIDTTTEKGKRNKAILLLVISCGLRINEIVLADIKDLQEVRNQKRLYIQGKGHKEKDDYKKIEPIVEEAILDYLKERPEAKKNDPLFTGTSNNGKGTRITETSLSRIFKTILKENGFDSSKYTSHSFRHSSATLLKETGASTIQVQQHLRHSQITTTTKYIHSYNKAKDTSEKQILDYIFKDDGKEEVPSIKEAIKSTIDRLSEGDLMKLSFFLKSL